MSTFEHARWGITSLSSSLCEDGRINVLKASVNKLQGMISDVVNDCCGSVKAIRHEVGELSTKLNLTIRAVDNQPVPAPGGIEFTRAKCLSLSIMRVLEMLKRSRTSSSIWNNTFEQCELTQRI